MKNRAILLKNAAKITIKYADMNARNKNSQVMNCSKIIKRFLNNTLRGLKNYMQNRASFFRKRSKYHQNKWREEGQI